MLWVQYNSPEDDGKYECQIVIVIIINMLNGKWYSGGLNPHVYHFFLASSHRRGLRAWMLALAFGGDVIVKLYILILAISQIDGKWYIFWL